MKQGLSVLAKAIAVATLASLSPLAPAFQPLITDDTGTQGSGGNQFEFSFNHDREEQAGATTRSRALPLVYTRGLSDALDVFAQANEGGSGNPSFGFKWRFHENEDSKTSLGMKAEVRHPPHPRAQGLTTYGITAILTQEVAFGAIHANLLIGQDTFRDSINFPRVRKTRYSMAPVCDVTDQLKLALDIGAEHATSAGTMSVSKFTELGLIYSPDKDIDIAAGIIRMADDAHPRTTISTATIGVTWRFR